MKLSVLDYLICLRCASSLVLKAGYTINATNDEIISGILNCSSCTTEYPIKRGVPRLINETSNAADLSTGRNFAVAWKTFPRLDARYYQQFFDWIHPVDSAFLKDKLILEGGCGKGRHAKIASESGVRAVLAVDIGEAVDVAYEKVGHLTGVHIIQADIENLPFRKEFDFVFSVGVLHHLAHPIKGFLSLVDKLKPDGAVCVWVYGRENNWWLIRLVNPIRVALTSKMPPSLLKFISSIIAIILYVLVKYVAHPWSQVRQKLPWLPKLFYQEYLSYIARFDFTEIHHIVFDHLIAPVANYVSEEYFRKWFDEAGFRNPIIRWHNKNSWTGFASFKPEVLKLMNTRIHTG